MYYTHPIRKRLIAQILLLSLFLQNCLNSPIPPAAPKHTSRANTTPLSTNKDNKVKDDTNFDLSNTTFTSNEAIKNRSDSAASLLLEPPTNASYLTDKGAQKSEDDLSRELPIPIITTQKGTQSANNDPVPSPSHDNNHPIARFVEQKPAHIGTSEQLKKTHFNKRNHHTPYKQLATSQKLAKAHKEVEKTEKEEKYEKESPSQISPKKLDTSSPIRYSVSSKLIAQISRKVFTAKGGHLVAFEWENSKCMAWVEESVSVGFTRKHALPVYLLPGMTWEKIATMSELEHKYDIQVFLERDKSCVIIGKTGLKGGGKTSLHNAIRGENVEKIKKLIARGVDLDAIDDSGNRPLFIAIYKDNKDIVELLIQAGANLEVKDKDGNTPLQYEIHYKDNKDIVELLIQAGANLEVKDKDGNTPLQYAIFYKDNKDIVELLIQAGAKLETTDKHGYTPLQYVIHYKDNKDIVELLIQAGVNLEVKDKDGNTPLQHVIHYRNNKDIVELLIQAGANLEVKDEDGNTPLQYEIHYKDNKDIVGLLIQAGANLEVKDKDGNTPLHLAIYKNNKDIVELLIQAGANLEVKDKDGNTSLHLAIKKEDMEAVKLLVAKGADINLKNENGNTPLHLAIEEGSPIEIIKHLITSGADVNEKNVEGYTPLHLVFLLNPIKAFFLIASAHEMSMLTTDIKSKNATAKTSIHTNLHLKQIEIVNHLISSGAHINATDNRNKTPLHLALIWNNEDIFKHLISLGADVNTKNNEGNTPLHIAVYRLLRVEIVNCLISSGAHTNVTNNDGNTPLHLAVTEDNIQELEEYQSNIGKAIIEFLDDNIQNKIGHYLSDETILERIWRSKVEMVHQLVISSDIDKNIKNNLEKSPIDIALENSNKELSEKLLNALEVNTPDSDEEGNTRLHRAISEGSIELVKSLVVSGADLHIKNNASSTPIDVASISKHLDHLPQIFPSGSTHINEIGSDGTCHLHRAAKRGDVKLLEALIQSGADINIKNKKQKTALHVAAKKGHKEILTTLLKEKALTNEQDQDGYTPQLSKVLN